MKKSILFLSVILVLFTCSSCKKEEELEPGPIIASTEESVSSLSPSPSPKITASPKPDATSLPRVSIKPVETSSPTISPTSPTSIPTSTPYIANTPVPKSTPIVKVTTVKITPEPTSTATKKPVYQTPEPIVSSTTIPIVAPTAIPTSEPTPEPVKDIYDIVLFFGQSNMNSWPQTNGAMPADFSNKHTYSIESGIDKDILDWTISTSFVRVPIKENCGYIYKVLVNKCVGTTYKGRYFSVHYCQKQAYQHKC